jgi:putative endonuclease
MGSLSGTLYIGMTGNLRKRVFEHKFHRMEGFTDKYQVERLLYRESFDEVQKAINREKQLKGWRRSKKIALIEAVNPHWLDLAREWFPWMTEADGATSTKCHPERSRRTPTAPMRPAQEDRDTQLRLWVVRYRRKSVGILRLRITIRSANRPAPLRMTALW